VKSDLERIQDAASRHGNALNGNGSVALLERDERANQGNPEITGWCPRCEERAVPTRAGLCGFCDTPLESGGNLASFGEDAAVISAEIQGDISAPAAGLDAGPKEEWPHTDGVIRRQVVDCDEPPDKHGAVKRQRMGDRAHGAILRPVAGPTDEEARLAEEVCDHSPLRSPILDWLKRHEKGTGPEMAEALGRAPKNVTTRLRQMEKAGLVRRTGVVVGGNQGTPQIEWELLPEGAEPNREIAGQRLTDARISQDEEERADMRQRYFAALLALVSPDCPEHIYDRIERLVAPPREAPTGDLP
jgi:DNA-binding Lrp family transcriptional regulator